MQGETSTRWRTRGIGDDRRDDPCYDCDAEDGLEEALRLLGEP
jgi:hypothetical protein